MNPTINTIDDMLSFITGLYPSYDFKIIDNIIIDTEYNVPIDMNRLNEQYDMIVDRHNRNAIKGRTISELSDIVLVDIQHLPTQHLVCNKICSTNNVVSMADIAFTDICMDTRCLYNVPLTSQLLDNVQYIITDDLLKYEDTDCIIINMSSEYSDDCDYNLTTLTNNINMSFVRIDNLLVYEVNESISTQTLSDINELKCSVIFLTNEFIDASMLEPFEYILPSDIRHIETNVYEVTQYNIFATIHSHHKTKYFDVTDFFYVFENYIKIGVSIPSVMLCHVLFVEGLIPINPLDYNYCCFDGNYLNEKGTKFTDLDSFWNGELIRKRRMLIAKHIAPDNCVECLSSNATLTTRLYNDTRFNESHIEHYNSEDGTLNKSPDSFGVSMNNVCNLSCKMCLPSISSTYSKLAYNKGIIDEDIGANPEINPICKLVTDQILETYKNTNKTDSTIHGVTITGGDSMFEYTALRSLVDQMYDNRKNIDVTIFSNGHVIAWDILDKLNDFHGCIINISLDGAQEENDNQRILSNRPRVIKNVLRIHNIYSNIKLQCHMAISNITMLSLPKFSDELVSDFQNIFCWVEPKLIMAPTYYSVSCVDDPVGIIKKLQENRSNLNSSLRPEIYKRFEKVHDDMIDIVKKSSNIKCDLDRFIELETLWDNNNNNNNNNNNTEL